MVSKIFYLKYIIIYQIILLYLSNIIICSKIAWNYEKCYQYINNLDIICLKMKKNKNGIEYCDEWEVNNIFFIFIIPEECYNKKYHLYLLVENSNKSDNFDLYIDKAKIIKIKNKDLQLFKNKKEDIKKCLIDFKKIFSGKLNAKKEKINERKKFKLSLFCYYAIDDIFNFIEKNENMIIKNNDNKEMDENRTIDYYLNNIKLENVENIMKNIYEYNNNERKTYFEEPNKKQYYENDYLKPSDDDNNELEKYYLSSRKDCIEYGLEPSKENIIICTKFE